MQTRLLYMEGLEVLSCTAIVMDVNKEGERDVVILDQTALYAQGGGQPADHGTITSSTSSFRVTDVRFVEGVVKHFGTFEGAPFHKGDTVTCQADAARRILNSRLHSGGHIVDMAVNQLGFTWTPGKGFHFPEGPYVEYTVADPSVLDKEALKKSIEETSNSLIRKSITTSLRFMPKEELEKICRSVPQNLPAGKPLRAVMYGDFAVPCGGTHVARLETIRHLTVRKIRIEGNLLRVSYEIEKP